MKLVRRFWKKVEIAPSGCWEWCGGRTGVGYGAFFVRGRGHGAHRIAYSIFVGPIPEGLQLDHLCRNRGCVNPAHLEVVTQQVNSLRGDLWNSRKTHCPQGHLYDGIDSKGGRICRTCTREYQRLWIRDKRRRAKA